MPFLLEDALDQSQWSYNACFNCRMYCRSGSRRAWMDSGWTPLTLCSRTTTTATSLVLTERTHFRSVSAHVLQSLCFSVVAIDVSECCTRSGKLATVGQHWEISCSEQRTLCGILGRASLKAGAALKSHVYMCGCHFWRFLSLEDSHHQPGTPSSSDPPPPPPGLGPPGPNPSPLSGRNLVWEELFCTVSGPVRVPGPRVHIAPARDTRSCPRLAEALRRVGQTHRQVHVRRLYSGREKDERY